MMARGATIPPFGNGMNEIYTPPSGVSAVINIVFIHGLFGHPYLTWTYTNKGKSPKTSPEAPSPSPSPGLEKPSSSTPLASKVTQDTIFWPRDLLPHIVPNARVYCFGYDADVEKFTVSTTASQNSVHEHGHSLLNALCDLLDEQAREPVPFIFIVHSLGGLVLKEALNQSSHSSNPRLHAPITLTQGCIFLSTPHRGSSAASHGRRLFRILELLALQRPNVKLLRALETTSEVLDALTTSFSDTLAKHPKIRIFCFVEEKETRILGVAGCRIVEPSSAKIGIGEWDSIAGNHRDMARFWGVEDAGFRKVAGVVRRWVREAEGGDAGPLGNLKGSELSAGRGEQAFHEPKKEEDSKFRTDDVSRTIKGGDAKGGGFSWKDSRVLVGGGYAGGAIVGRDTTKGVSGRVIEAEAGGGHLGPQSGHGGDARGGIVEINWP